MEASGIRINTVASTSSTSAVRSGTWACRRPERLRRSLGALRPSVQFDGDALRPVGVEPRVDPLKLLVQLGLNL